MKRGAFYAGKKINSGCAAAGLRAGSGGTEPQNTYLNEYDAVHWNYTEKGYLFFGAEHQTGDFEPWLETAIRVKPLDDELRVATEKYLNVLGYEDNNLFIENWDEQDLEWVLKRM